MADDTDTDTDPEAGSPAAKRKGDKKRQQVLIGVGVAGLILTFLLLRGRSSSSSSGQAQTAPPGYDPTYGNGYGGYGAGAAGGYGDLSSLTQSVAAMQSNEQGMLTILQQLEAQMAAAPPPAAGGNGSPSSGGSAAGYGGIAGFTEVTNPEAGGAYGAAGVPIYVLPAGMPATAADLIPFKAGVHYAPGSHEYIKG